jgi:Transposase
MSRMASDTSKGRRSRRRFEDEFKAHAVRLVLDEGKSIAAVAGDLDLTPSRPRSLGGAGTSGPDEGAFGPDDRRA